MKIKKVFVRKIIGLIAILIFCISIVNAASLITKIEFEITKFTGITQLDNSDGVSVNVSILNTSTGIIANRSTAVGIYKENMTIITTGAKLNLSYNKNYTYNLSTDYGDFLYNFTTPVAVRVDYYQQSLIDYDDYKDANTTTGEYTGEEATWTETAGNMDGDCFDAGDVCLDERTGLYWSDKNESTKTNNFTLATCAFFTTEPRGDYDGSDTDCGVTTGGDAINYCATLSLPSKNGGATDTDWYLPSQKELLQAYIDGAENNIVNAYPGSPVNYWSSTELSDSSSNAWNVVLSDGRVNNPAKGNLYWVRCVRRD